MSSFAFTFDAEDLDAEGQSLAGKFVVVEGDKISSKARIISARGIRWAFQYSLPKIRELQKMHGIEEVSLDSVTLNQYEAPAETDWVLVSCMVPKDLKQSAIDTLRVKYDARPLKTR